MNNLMNQTPDKTCPKKRRISQDVAGMTDAIDGPDEVTGSLTCENELSSPPQLTNGTPSSAQLPACKSRRNYFCKLCELCTTNPREYLHHLRATHSQSIRIYSCAECMYASRNKVKLVRHTRAVHGHELSASEAFLDASGPDSWGAQYVSADSCSRSSSRPCVPGGSMSAAGVDEEFVDCGGEGGAPQADDGANGEEAVDSVIVASDPSQPLSVGETVSDASSPSELPTGVGINQGGGGGLKQKFYRCSQCDYMTHVRSRYLKHVRYHSMPMIRCSLCAFQTPYKWNLDRHMKNHTGDGDYKCSVCSFTAQNKQSLTVHIQNHHSPEQRAAVEYVGPMLSSGGVASAVIPPGILHDSSDSEQNMEIGFPNHRASMPFHSGIDRKWSVFDNRSNQLSDSKMLNCHVSGETAESRSDNYLLHDGLNSLSDVLSFPNVANMKIKDMERDSIEKLAEEAAKVFLSTDSSANHLKHSVSVLKNLFPTNKTYDGASLLTNDMDYKAKSIINTDESANSHRQAEPMTKRFKSSGRCRFCRHRCKSTNDLLAHERCCRANKCDQSQELEHTVQSVCDDECVDKEVFQCPSCDFWSLDTSRFHLHMAGHADLKPFSCSACCFVSNWCSDVENHIRSHTLKSESIRASSDVHGAATILVKDMFILSNQLSISNYSEFLTVKCLPNNVLFPSTDSAAIDVAKFSKYFSLTSSITITPSHLTNSQTNGKQALRVLQQLDPSLSANDITLSNTAIVIPQPPPDALASSEKCLPELSVTCKKSTVWRCKKCNFRHTDYDTVERHCQQHALELAASGDLEPLKARDARPVPFAVAALAESPVSASSRQAATETPSARDALVSASTGSTASLGANVLLSQLMDCSSITPRLGSDVSISVVSNRKPLSSDCNFCCDICSYTCVGDAQTISQHMSHHTPYRGATYKCLICPYYASSQIELLDHIPVHKISSTDYAHLMIESTASADVDKNRVKFEDTLEAHNECNIISLNPGSDNPRSPHSPSLTSPYSGPSPHTRHLIHSAQPFNHRSPADSQSNNTSLYGNSDVRAKSTTGALCVTSVAASQTSAERQETRRLYFCPQCPARFFYPHEIATHVRFHDCAQLALPFVCRLCNYSARQQKHLEAHMRVHTAEYVQRSRSLMFLYEVAPQWPPVVTACDAEGTASQIVVGEAEGRESLAVQTAAEASVSPAQLTRRRCCHKCPARFVKEAALRSHLTLHGADAPYKCSRCDYAVRSYSSLTQHINLHVQADASHIDGTSESLTELLEQQKMKDSVVPVDDFPMSGIDLLRRKLNIQQRGGAVTDLHTTESSAAGDRRAVTAFDARTLAPSMCANFASNVSKDHPFYEQRTGNPDFIYPTVVDKYGRERAKRYKCRKCPSAFEKREQYTKHASLHGVTGRFTCTHCDYAVNYYPNFCNHMKRHGVPPLPMSLASHRTVSVSDVTSERPPGGCRDEEAVGGATECCPEEEEVVVVDKDCGGRVGVGGEVEESLSDRSCDEDVVTGGTSAQKGAPDVFARERAHATGVDGAAEMCYEEGKTLCV